MALVLSGICIVKVLQPKEEYLFETELILQEGTDLAATITVCEGISLPPGVYCVEMNYDTDGNYRDLCTVTDDTVYQGGLLTNGEHLHEGLESTSFHMWLLESTDALRVEIEYQGEGFIHVNNIRIRDTGLLWSMLLTIILSTLLFLYLCISFFEKSKRNEISSEQKDIIAGLSLIFLVASIPNLLGECTAGADFTYHLHRIEGVKEGLLSGQFPVRLEPQWLQGHGYANAIFYCNWLLTIPAIFRLLGFTVIQSYNVFAIFLNGLTIGISYYCFGKIFKNRYIGLICSALYTLSIYRISKIVISSAVGEGSAIAFMPLILYGLYRVFTENPKEKNYSTAWIPIAFGYAGLVQTHVLSCEITAFLTLIVCLLCIRKVFQFKVFLELGKGAGAAVLLSLWYLVPFLDYFINEDVHVRHVSARMIQHRGLLPAQLGYHFWKAGSNAINGEFGMQYASAMGIGFALSIAMMMFFVLWSMGKLQGCKEPLMQLGKISLVLATGLIVMSLSIFPWDTIQKLHPIVASLVSSIQFPNRFLGWATVFCVVLFGCCLWYFQNKKQKWFYYGGIVLSLLAITTSSMYLLDFVLKEQKKFTLYNEEGMGFGYISGAEYLIEGTKEELLMYHNPVASEGICLESYAKEYLHVLMECKNLTAESGYIELPILHYKGYRAYTGEHEGLLVKKGNNNVVRVDVPANFHGQIEVKFVSPIYWRIAEVITVVMYFMFAGMIWYQYSQKKMK